MIETQRYPYNQFIVSLGGGTGHWSLLRGEVQLNNPEKITAVAGTWDSGGRSGQQRVEEGILPPGDYMQCLLALMEDEDQLKEAIVILRERSEGRPLVNELAAKSEKAHHGVEEGINGLRRLFRIRAQILLATLIDVDLNGETKKGIYFEHEDKIDELKNDPSFCIKDEVSQIYFDKPADANPRVLSAFGEADKIVIPPGSPYTSIFPHLLVKRVPETIREAPGKLIAVLNLMTTQGEDHHLSTASKWLQVFQYYLGDREWIKKTGRSRLDYLIVNENHINQEVLDIYRGKGQKPIEIDLDECKKMAPGLEVVPINVAHYDRYSHLLRHDPLKLAKVVLSL